MKKELSPPTIVSLIVAVLLIVALIGYFIFRPAPTLYKPELLKGKRSKGTR